MPEKSLPTKTSVLDFWYSPVIQPYWFNSYPALDLEIKDKFESTWVQASQGSLDCWTDTPLGALALIIVLDQFPLNMYRSDALRYSTEALARSWSHRVISQEWDKQMKDNEKLFIYLPFMHSESIEDQRLSLTLFKSTEIEGSMKWVNHHYELIRRFGRFPHRNEALGRVSTSEELAYLASDEAFHG